MRQTLLFNYGESFHAIEREEKQKFLRAILESLGIDVSNFWATNQEIDKAIYSNLKEVYSHYDISVLDYEDNKMEVYVEKELIARWEVIQYRIKEDHSVIDPRKRFYVEMIIDIFSTFIEE